MSSLLLLQLLSSKKWLFAVFGSVSEFENNEKL
jgi:hypothetical protein